MMPARLGSSSMLRFGRLCQTTAAGASALTLYAIAKREAHTTGESGERTFCMDPFGARQFDATNTKVSCNIHFDPDQFTATIEEAYNTRRAGGETEVLKGGYAPFCKHIFVKNFVGVKVGYMPITPDNEHLLRTSYEARTERELAVLGRFFPSEAVEAPEATFLDVILYSREQLIIENEAQGSACTQTEPWGIISIKPQLEDYETPMNPITMMRNALPKNEGGSGVSLGAEEYRKSVAFWSTHAVIK